jgi:hypothetical protein
MSSQNFYTIKPGGIKQLLQDPAGLVKTDDRAGQAFDVATLRRELCRNAVRGIFSLRGRTETPGFLHSIPERTDLYAL